MAIVTTDAEWYRNRFDSNSWWESFVLSSTEVKTLESINDDINDWESFDGRSMSVIGLKVLGIVTLEDVLECMLNREILDEQDHDQLLML